MGETQILYLPLSIGPTHAFHEGEPNNIIYVAYWNMVYLNALYRGSEAISSTLI